MKVKITKIKRCKELADRLAGKAVWRITFPCPISGKRDTVVTTCTREAAEELAKRRSRG